MVFNYLMVKLLMVWCLCLLNEMEQVELVQKCVEWCFKDMMVLKEVCEIGYELEDVEVYMEWVFDGFVRVIMLSVLV